MVNFVLDAFASSGTMDISASLDEGEAKTILAADISAIGVYYINVDTLKSVFRFSSNSWDINDVSAEDVHYFTFMENWPTDLLINPVHAMMDKSDSADAILTGLAADKMLVKHDFIRYISLKLFNTPHGVDLFNNEAAILNNLKSLGETSFNTDISGMMWAKQAWTSADSVYTYNPYDNTNDGTKWFVDVSVNRVGTTDAFNSVQNLPRELFRQILASAESRFNDISFVDIDVDGVTVSNTAAIPFEDGDTISYLFTINPATNQHALTGVNAFGGRVYKIQLMVTSSDTSSLNTTPTD
tara:strand:- start:3069 stop:3962 length:894 start_codon:yes stop_codon:yes gene_type:complete